MDTSTPSEFSAAADEVVALLRDRTGMGFWSVTRVVADQQVVLAAVDDAGYGLASWSWEDSYCIHMLGGEAPGVAPDAQSVTAYAGAGVNRELEIGAYVGSPIRLGGGELFGVLCGLDRAAQPIGLVEVGPLVDTLSSLLGRIIRLELARDEAAVHAMRAQAESMVDALTGLFNRRAWERLVAMEEERRRRYADESAVIVLDLDGLKRINDGEGHAAGDALIARAAHVLLDATRESDMVARLGGDEFAVLGVRTGPEDAAVLERRIRTAFEGAGVAASIGTAATGGTTDLNMAFAAADAAMYADKTARGSARGQLGA